MSMSYVHKCGFHSFWALSGAELTDYFTIAVHWGILRCATVYLEFLNSTEQQNFPVQAANENKNALFPHA